MLSVELRSDLVLRSVQLGFDEADPLLKRQPLALRMRGTPVFSPMLLDFGQEGSKASQQNAALVQVEVDGNLRRPSFLRMAGHLRGA